MRLPVRFAVKSMRDDLPSGYKHGSVLSMPRNTSDAPQGASPHNAPTGAGVEEPSTDACPDLDAPKPSHFDHAPPTLTCCTDIASQGSGAAGPQCATDGCPFARTPSRGRSPAAVERQLGGRRVSSMTSRSRSRGRPNTIHTRESDANTMVIGQLHTRTAVLATALPILSFSEHACHSLQLTPAFQHFFCSGRAKPIRSLLPDTAMMLREIGAMVLSGAAQTPVGSMENKRHWQLWLMLSRMLLADNLHANHRNHNTGHSTDPNVNQLVRYRVQQFRNGDWTPLLLNYTQLVDTQNRPQAKNAKTSMVYTPSVRPLPKRLATARSHLDGNRLSKAMQALRPSIPPCDRCKFMGSIAKSAWPL